MQGSEEAARAIRLIHSGFKRSREGVGSIHTITLGDIDPLNKAPFKKPEIGLRRVPFKGSP